MCAVIPIGFVTIVLAGVVAGGDIHTRLATEVAEGERNFGSGTEVFEEVNLNPVGREDIGDRFCKQTAVVTAIVANNN